ncbi:type II toxin-antitoxin system RelE/ParE family toxin [uncultured Bartonella sp.]|uniref:type II toxin-antitoxin system RelE/ParE family toxin n=1 Tax=uncultured Bartonella sp. TaxID=104108 RepID=UPI00262ECB1E|nr:type II toxin-antitoxin system RelE/ParE family toxin [uncultured Bartonella sp.]
MSTFRLQQAAVFRLDEIYRYTSVKRGDLQAEAYINGLFECFQAIANDQVMSRPIPAEFAVHGYFYCYEHHYIYWKKLKNGDTGIVTILHERMHQIDRFKDDFMNV